MRAKSLLEAAARIDPARASELATTFAKLARRGSTAHATATMLATAYPALEPALLSDPTIASELAEDKALATRNREVLFARARSKVGENDLERTQRELRRFARFERARVALREALPRSLGGADVDVTAAELSALADVTIQLAFEEALAALSARFGPPRASNGPARFVVLGMGKLGGDELNAGSDVDLIYFYDTDDGAAGEITLHDFWTRLAKRMTATLEEVTEFGFVWRVDLRLRPEGRSGPVVNSLHAAERYYESFGRLWERAALLRARPVAGDLAFGDELLDVLAPFVWRRRVDPRVAVEMVSLAERSRAELAQHAERDLKLAPGGIREAEFFVQSLQLIWGGREPRVRARKTIDGLHRLRAAGLVSDREVNVVSEAYLALRRAEHFVQAATGVQTHERFDEGPALDRLGRALGFDDGKSFLRDLEPRMRAVAALFVGLAPGEVPAISKWNEAIARLERNDAEGFAAAIAPLVRIATGDQSERADDLARDLFDLSRHPDKPLGARSREAFPRLAEIVLDAVVDAADPELAAKNLRRFFNRLRQPGVYVKLLAEDPHALRKLVEAFGASAFVGDAVIRNPDLGDAVLFARSAPTPDAVRAEVDQAIALAKDIDEEPEERLVSALRVAKSRVTIEIAMADLAGEIALRDAMLALSALADASLEAATRFALGGDVRGLAVIAMGKLGGREIGYGSDLDVLFLFDPSAAPEGKDPDEYFARAARRIIRAISITHGDGPGYELDTRLRPSGNQGLLVTSLEAFARYHGVASDGGSGPGARAQVWERLALLRARHAAGDVELGARAIAIAHAAAYGGLDDPSEAAREIDRLRARLQHEQAQEREGRFDLKLGKGGLLDVEFATQLLQMKHGDDRRVRTSETSVAIDALESAGHLDAELGAVLRSGYAFLRALEQRIRVVHGAAASLLEVNAPGLPQLARRIGIRDRPGREAAGVLISRYLDTTSRVRAAYDAIVKPNPSASPDSIG